MYSRESISENDLTERICGMTSKFLEPSLPSRVLKLSPKTPPINDATLPKEELVGEVHTDSYRKPKVAFFLGKKEDQPLSKQLIVGHMDKEQTRFQQPGETLVSGRIYSKSKVSPGGRSVLNHNKSPEAGSLVGEAPRKLQKWQDSSNRTALAHHISGSASTKKMTLCNDCRASSKKTICFIANNGRVAACSSGPAERVPCKHHWCAASDPDYVSPTTQTRKFLVSKRHSLKPQTVSKSKDNKTSSPLSGDKGSLADQFSSPSDGFSSPCTEADDAKSYSDDGSRCILKFCCQNESTENENNSLRSFDTDDSSRELGEQIVNDRRSNRSSTGCKEYIDNVQKQESGNVKSKGQSGERMTHCATEDAVQKLARNGENRLKLLVEAFESILSNNDGETHVQNCGGGHDQKHSHAHIAMRY